MPLSDHQPYICCRGHAVDSCPEAAARADTDALRARVAALEGALGRLLPSDAIIDSCGDYEDIEVGYRCQGWQAREWRALTASDASAP